MRMITRLALSIFAVGLFCGPALSQTYRETTYSYNTRGLPATASVVGISGSTNFAWDAAGNLTSVTDASGHAITADYDGARRVVSMTVAPGTNQMRTRYRYDASGRLQYVDASPDGTASPSSWVTSEAVYTPDGRVTSLIDPAGDTQVFTYDNAGRLLTSADGEGRTVRRSYLADGLVSYVREAYGTSEVVFTERHFYNALGERTQFRPANSFAANPGIAANTGDFGTYWYFDAFGRMDQTQYPIPADGVARPREYFAYDENGNPLSFTTRAGDTIAMTYDASGRVLTSTAPITIGSSTTATTTTTYNLAGDPLTVTATDQHGAGPNPWGLSYTYDFAGRLLTETQTRPEGGASRTVSYQYDGAGNRTRITWPDGFFVKYVYDNANRLTHIYANGTALLSWYRYDAQGRVDANVLSVVQGQSVGTIFPTYEIDGDLDALDYRFSNDTNVVFDYSYDQSGYLTGQAISNPDWRWSPLRAATQGGAVYSTASYTTNRLDQYTEVTGLPVSYDLNGNLTHLERAGMALDADYIYSAQNQLLQATTLSGGTALYSYGPAARRVRSSVEGVVTEFLHAGGMEIAEYAASGTLLRRYIPGPGVDQRILMVDCGTSAGCIPSQAGSHTQYYFADRQGNALAVTDNTGAIEQHFFYTPFGVELEGDPSGNPFRYTGRRFDAETGLYYYRARYYDADLGRFLQVDPVGYADQWNLYAYVGNNPLNATDPTGMDACTSRGCSDQMNIYTGELRPVETTTQGLHTALDIAGMSEPFGFVADGVNAGIYLIEGDYINSGISGAALLPLLGSMATGSRLGLKVGDALLSNVDNAARTGTDALSLSVRGTGDTFSVSVDMLVSADGGALSVGQVRSAIDQLTTLARQEGSSALEITWIAGGDPSVERIGGAIAQRYGGTYRLADDGVTQVIRIPVGE